MTAIYYLSDIHNDHSGLNELARLEVPDSKDSILVVAGDINSKGRMVRDLEEVADNWKHIVAVPGNHDWWGLAIHEHHKFTSSAPNVHILNHSHVVLDDILFAGTTLWTAMDGPFDELDYRMYMNCATKIRGPDWQRLRAYHLHTEHLKGINCIEQAGNIKHDKKVLITHHAMSRTSVPLKYAQHPATKFYYTDLEHLLTPYDIYIHGHIHEVKDYRVGSCRVLCNPKGYDGEKTNYVGLKKVLV